MELVRHVVASPQNFVDMFSGDDVYWANPPKLGDDPASDFRAGAERLVGHLESGDADGADQCGDPGVRGSQLGSRDVDRSQRPLDDELAEHALAFMSANLTPENRAGAFQPEVPADASASVHDRLAAFAGRSLK